MVVPSLFLFFLPPYPLLTGGNKDQVDGLDSLGTRKPEKRSAQNDG
jgi:hypothetical protein